MISLCSLDWPKRSCTHLQLDLALDMGAPPALDVPPPPASDQPTPRHRTAPHRTRTTKNVVVPQQPAHDDHVTLQLAPAAAPLRRG